MIGSSLPLFLHSNFISSTASVQQLYVNTAIVLAYLYCSNITNPISVRIHDKFACQSSNSKSSTRIRTQNSSFEDRNEPNECDELSRVPELMFKTERYTYRRSRMRTTSDVTPGGVGIHRVHINPSLWVGKKIRNSSHLRGVRGASITVRVVT